jgi:hypothetical protein
MVDSSFLGAGLSSSGGFFATNAQISYVNYNGFYIPWETRTNASSSAPATAAVSASTGVNPTELSYSLYGHIIPLSVFGVGRIGGDIIAGPWIANGRASFIISFGVPADPSGTRTLREIAFDSEVVWTASGGFAAEPFTYRFYGGTLSQAADPLETANFGSQAVAYRPQILIAFENLPLANTKFGKIPYVAAVIADATGDDVNLGEAFERLAYSPWVGFTSSQFETSGITDGLVSGGLIFAQDTEFLQAIQTFGRFYPTWNIVQTDKLRITDRGGTISPDIVLNGTSLTGNVVVNRQGPDTVARELELSTIDPDADYTIVPFRAVLPRDPVAVTTSVGTDTAYLPAIMDASTRAAVATFTQYHEHLTRKTVSGVAMAYGLEIEPGDFVQISDIGDDFSNDIFRVVQTMHGVNCTVEFTAEPLLRCDTHICGFDPATTLYTTLSNSNLTATGTAPGDGGARMIPDAERTSGKYYYEITWVTLGGFLFGGEIGVITSTATYGNMNGAVNSAVLFQGTTFTEGQIWSSGVYSGYNLGHITAGDVIGIAVDLDNRKIWFRNVTTGGTYNNASGNPTSNINGVTVPAGTILPAVAFGLNNDVYTANFGSSSFVGTPPTGFAYGWPC